MKMVRYYKSGGPEVLQIEEVAIPLPEAGQVLIKVEAIDVGYVDTQMRNEGSPWGTPSFPVAPGDYVYGTVVQIGSGVDEVHEGEHMLGFAPSGAYAEYALVPLSLRFHPLPDAKLSPVELVTLPVAGETAYHILATSAQVRPGERVLIHAAAGGIGHFAVILDVVGGQILIESLPLLAPFGRLIFYGAASGNVPALPPESLSNLMMGLKRIEGFSSFTLMQHHADLIAQGRQAFRHYVEQGKVRPRIMRTFALEDVAQAHHLLESRASYGKIVLCP